MPFVLHSAVDLIGTMSRSTRCFASARSGSRALFFRDPQEINRIGFQLLCCLLKTVDDVLFVSGNSDAVFVICFHFLGDSVYYPVAAQMRIGLGIALGLGRKDCRPPRRAIFAPRWLPS
jgi:hypothetical protein